MCLNGLLAQSPGQPQESQRLESSVILEELLNQGIIPAQSKMGGSGEAYNIMVSSLFLLHFKDKFLWHFKDMTVCMLNVYGVLQLKDAERPRKRPPPRLESLKIRKEQEVTRKEDIDEKMRQVEERRKVQQTQISCFSGSLYCWIKK